MNLRLSIKFGYSKTLKKLERTLVNRNRITTDLGRIYASRRRKTFALARKQRAVDALLISKYVDVEYLTGFDGDESYLLLGDGWATLVTDGRFTEWAEAQTQGQIDVHTRKGAMSKAVADCLKGRRVRALGFQSADMIVAFEKNLQKALGSKKLYPLAGMVSELRQIKNDIEIDRIKKSVRIAEKAFKQLRSKGASYWIGRTERQIAAELDYLMKCAGAEKPSFDTMVAVGSEGSKPHYMSSNKKVKSGQPIIIDWGAKCNGYCSDLTRMVFIGRIPRQISEIFDIVKDAHEAAAELIRPGVKISNLDGAARKIIDQAGYGDKFIHSLGHGLGKEVHELPGLGGKSMARMKKGHVVTIEPGIYLPRVGGVRIEDDYVVTSNGAERLGSLGKKKTDMILD